MAESRICSIPGCGKPPCNIRGWCSTHYKRWTRHGDPLAISEKARPNVRATCSVEGCDKPHSAKGYCGQHYRKFIRCGDPHAGRRYVLHGTHCEFIDEAIDFHETDVCLIWPYHRTRKGYAVATVDGVRTTVSRYICGKINGPSPTVEHQAAHNCGNGHLGCINPHHLRWATPSENQMDKHIHGTMTLGENSILSHLTEKDVIAIRRLRPTMRVKDLAQKFGCSRGLIWLICTRRIWRHI